MGFDDNHSYTHHRSKSVQSWINSCDLRSAWYGRKCPVCGDLLVFTLTKDRLKVKKVSCFECDWEAN